MLKLTERNAPSKGSFYRVAIKKVKLTTEISIPVVRSTGKK